MSNATAPVETPAINFAIGIPVMFFFYVIGDHLSRLDTRVTFVFYFLGLMGWPLWLLQPLEGTFEYVKIISIFVPIQLFNGIRLSMMITHTHKEESVRRCGFGCLDDYLLRPVRTRVKLIYLWWVLLTVLAVNILEAVLTDLTVNNYFNAAAGAILVVTLPFPALERGKEQEHWPRNHRFMGIDTHPEGSGLYDFLFDLPLFWILLYTSWNACFALDERASNAASIMAVLGAALARALFQNRYDLWMQSRVYTLALRYLVLGNYDVYEEFVDSSQWFDPDSVRFWGIINLVLAILYMAWYFAEVFELTDKEPFFLPGPPTFPAGEVKIPDKEVERRTAHPPATLPPEV